MATMTTKTNIRTEFAGMGLKPDGKWKPVTQKAGNAADAEKFLKEHLYDVERYPGLYTRYDEYKVMKRTVITVTEDWGEV